MNTEKSDLKNREDVKVLVTTFYKKVRKDEILGPIFNSIIKDWTHHIDRLTDFWETNLLFVSKFKGNPISVHNRVDEIYKNKISNLHFGIWLRLWITTIDDLYFGEKAILAKNRARKMGTTFFIKIFQNRISADA